MEQESLVASLRLLAQQCLRISPELNQLYLDQMAIIGHLNAQNLIKIQQDQCRIELLDGLFYIQFHTPYALDSGAAPALVDSHFYFQQCKAEALEEFFLQDIYFLTGDLKPQHSLYLRDKAKQLRQLILAQVYAWVNGLERVSEFLQQMSIVQAEIIDQQLIKAGLYTAPVMQNFIQDEQEIPQQTLESLQQAFSLECLQQDEFLSIQSLMDSLDEFCFSAAQFLPPALFRIMSLSFEERFNLHELNDHTDDICLLYRHAEEQSNLLGFVRLMNRDVWHRDDLLSKRNFLENHPYLWQKKVARLPLFDCHRAVNWIFKQPAEVLDWISNNIQHSSVRVAVTALSFVDSHHIHPQIILATLQYFQYVSARLFIHSMHEYAIQHDWFQHQYNQAVVLKGTRQSIEDQRIAISPSILYLDEWMELLRNVVKMDDQLTKKVYLNLSRVMQAYMQHLYKITAHLPDEVLVYIQPQSQQNRDFYNVLHRYRIPFTEFRQLFYLQSGHVRESLFDSYVRDYLVEYFSSHTEIPKNLSWTSLFNQAVVWHDQIQKQEMIAKLKKQFALVNWTPITQVSFLLYFNWRFEELKTLDRILEESKIFRNCLAASYAQQIVERQYVAFRMSHPAVHLPLILGCQLVNGQVIFDQLEYPNNQKAEAEYSNIAMHFINWLNLQA
ncbi:MULTISPECIES: hypothetical protein [unclassified Acinetobacter]|uniref:hypothetical protein n=1 Tax=unclassified Acinetobacter TaxID=196816 RepID=UPI00288146A9|nr:MULTISPECIES: hypothetical protein [unclassified Acinetobacter]MDT0198573.1 hypothetical protein [Acinetobacter sp. RG5]MDT0230173.1 hypothetical protein [Acinetobacter sp. RRD8]